MAQDGHTVSAAKLCADYVSPTGYDDWYLPTIDELKLIYLHKGLIGGFKNSGYWSSSEYDSGSGFYINFDNGTMDEHGKKH